MVFALPAESYLQAQVSESRVTNMEIKQPRYPRLRANLRIRIHGMYMATTNISLSGAQVSCPAMKYQVLGAKLASGDAPVQIVLDDDRIDGKAKVMYASDYGDEFLLGVVFTGFEPESDTRFRAYLMAQGGPEFLQIEAGATE